MRVRPVALMVGVALSMGAAPNAGALTLTVEQSIPVPVAGQSVPPANAEGIAVIHSGANAGIYIPHRSSSLVTVLGLDGSFLYNFDAGIGDNLRSIDVLPNGNLVIGRHTNDYVREVVIPGNPGNGSTPLATLGTISFTLPVHTSTGAVFDEFEALSAFSRPSDGQVFLLLAEEGQEFPLGSGTELPGEVYLGTVSGSGISSFERLFEVPLADNFDDISGLDVIDVVFDASGALDRAASRVIITDDSSGNNSGAFVMDLTGQIIETLAGPGSATGENFESLFDQPWRDVEGADFDPATGLLTVFVSDGGSPNQNNTGLPSQPRILVLDVGFEGPPPTPEPRAIVLIGLGLAGVGLLRRRVS